MQETPSVHQPLPPGLYVVATPIGNLADMTARALETLVRVKLIAAEDTRVTARLLARYAIATPMLAYHDHNAQKVRPELIRRALHEPVALVSDAGTPLISDPGFKLVRDAALAGVAVVPLPGPSALTAALSIAGLPTDRVMFLGFLPARSHGRREELTGVKAIKATLVIYETAPRLAASLADAAAVLGDRPAVVARELTKAFEEVRRGTLATLAAHYHEAGPPKGEIVLVIGPQADEPKPSPQDIDALLRSALAHGTVREAVEAVTVATGQPRKLIYARALSLKDNA